MPEIRSFWPLTFEWATLWTLYYHIKVSQIVIMGLSRNSRCRIRNKAFCFL